MLDSILDLSRPLVCLDLETTGLSKTHDRILQIAIIKMYPDSEVKEWESIVNPMMDIPQEATNVHKITNAMASVAPTFKKLSPTLAAGFKDCDFCGYNVDFDLSFLVNEFARVGYEFKPGRIIDAFKIFIKYNPRDLTAAVREYLNEDMVDAHQAMADTRATLRVLVAQFKRYNELPRTVEELHRLFYSIPEGFLDPERKMMWRNREPVFTFGQYEYESIFSKVPKKYLNWIMREDFSSYIKNVVGRALKGEYFDREEYEKEMSELQTKS